MLKKLQSFGVALDFLSVFLSVLCLLRQHIGVVDLSNYARAMFTWPALRPWRLLLPRLMPVIFDNKPSFGGCQLARAPFRKRSNKHYFGTALSMWPESQIHARAWPGSCSVEHDVLEVDFTCRCCDRTSPADAAVSHVGLSSEDVVAYCL